MRALARARDGNHANWETIKITEVSRRADKKKKGRQFSVVVRDFFTRGLLYGAGNGQIYRRGTEVKRASAKSNDRSEFLLTISRSKAAETFLSSRETFGILTNGTSGAEKQGISNDSVEKPESPTESSRNAKNREAQDDMHSK